ncbi:MAG: heat-inducible transcription repressor HrcA [Candidatus Schekmanbacteria bacterium]|nr:heat-inducible transcription repressor HrcA [Candidatus Schekmanbacteria bacterium]
MENLTEREKSVLWAIIQSYMVSPEPVGSGSIAKMSNFDISPATIRNVMADLEESGYLTHPHTSAGRIPTDKAYRIYVNSILSEDGINPAKLDAEALSLEREPASIEELLKQTTRFLSRKSHNMGIISAPKINFVTLKHIEFIRLKKQHILAIIIGESGLVENKVINTEEDILQGELDKVRNFINESFHGSTLPEIKRKLREMLLEDKRNFDELVEKAMKLSNLMFSFSGEGEIYYDGTSNLIEEPEFSGTEEMKKLLSAFEEKSLILKILDKCLAANGVTIYIGAEASIGEMADLSIIAATYKKGDKAIGTLGVLGPKRMNYSMVIPIVNYTAKTVSELLTQS